MNRKDALIIGILAFALVSCGVGLLHAIIPQNTLRSVDIGGNYRLFGVFQEINTTRILQGTSVRMDAGGNANFTTINTGYGAFEIGQDLRTTDSVNFSRVEADEYFLNAVNITDITYQDYSYIVWTKGVNYYAKNGETGATDYTDTNCSNLFSTIYTNPNIGKVFVKNGNYTVTHSILPNSNTILEGEGWGTLFYYSGEQWCFYLKGENIIIRDFSIDIAPGAGSANTRPDGVRSQDLDTFTISHLRVIGDRTEASDGQQEYQTGLCGENTTNGLIEENWVSEQAISGIQFTRSTYNKFINNHVWDCNAYGIDLFDTEETDASNNVIYRTGFHGFLISGIGLTLNDNLIYNCTQDGMRLTIATNSLIANNHILNCSRYGISTQATLYNASFIGNKITNVGLNGFQIGGSQHNMFKQNDIISTGRSGINLDTVTNEASYNEFIGNHIENYDLSASAYPGISINDGDYNIFRENSIINGDTYAVRVFSGSSYNRFQQNDYRGYTTLALRDDDGTTIVDSVYYQFTDAVNGEVSTTGPIGIDIDAATEAALVWGQLPDGLHQIVRIKIWAVSTGIPINAGGQMHLTITFNAGSSDAAYNTASKSWSLSDFDGEVTDYSANDVIYWNIVRGDVSNEIDGLLALDSFGVTVTYNAGADPDGATDAVFRVIEIDYV